MKKKETDIQRLKRLVREANAMQEEISKLTQSTVGDVILDGLRKCGAANAIFEIKSINHLVISGTIDYPSRTEVNDLFDLDTFSNGIKSGQLGKYHMFVQAVDGRTEYSISWPQKDVPFADLRKNVYKNVAMTREFLGKMGIIFGINMLKEKKAKLSAEMLEIDKFIRIAETSTVLAGNVKTATKHK